MRDEKYTEMTFSDDSVLSEDVQSAEENKYFNKQQCIENIRELLKTSNVKIGQIEKDAGYTAGYLSRIEKEGNKSDPSIVFLCTVANLLNVTIDSLVKGSLKELTATEQYLLDFIERLKEDTKNCDISWKKETEEQLKNIRYSGGSLKTEHPLFRVGSEEISPGKFFPYGTEYSSEFHKDSIISPSGNSYNADLPGTNEKIYLMSVKNTENDDQFFELYIVGKFVNPICSSSQTCDSIFSAVKDLYNEIAIASAHVQLNEHTKNVISQYLLNRIDIDVPF